MDPVQAIGSSLSVSRANMLAARAVESVLSQVPTSQSDRSLPAVLDAIPGADPATRQQLMAQFKSHVDAACFLSLLQILDPLPDDERDRAEYKRRYRQLRDVLELPPPLPDPRPIGAPPGCPIDPLR
jgi:hypothetical protein